MKKLLVIIRNLGIIRRPMKVTDINSKTLSTLLALTKKKETLQTKISEIDKQIAALASGDTSTIKNILRQASARGNRRAKAKNAAGRRGPKTPRGVMQQQITELLHAAGEIGLTIKEIAEKVGKPKANINVWFSTTGKKLNLFKRLEGGRVKLLGHAETAAPAEPAEPTAPTVQEETPAQ